MREMPAVFISHSTRDATTANRVCEALEQKNIRCWIAPRDIPGGDSWDEAIIKGLNCSRAVVLIFSSHANQSPHIKKELHFALDKGKVVLPFRIEDVNPGQALEFILIGLQWINAISPPVESHFDALVERVSSLVNQDGHSGATQSMQTPRASSTSPSQTALTDEAPIAPPRGSAVNGRRAEKSLRVALLYRRNVQPDDHVLSLLESGLRKAGHQVFVDRHLQPGVEWATEIERQVRESDAVIPLISPSSLESEMLQWEIRTASEAAQKQLGKPRIIPVRVNFEGGLPEPFHSILGKLQYALWRNASDDDRLISELQDCLEAKEPPKLLQTPGGALPLDYRYYIVQPADREYCAALAKQDSIVLVKGARQMGKTSLLARGLQEARKASKVVASLDFQKLNQANLSDIESLYKGLGGMIADQLDLDVLPEEVWRAGRAPSVNFERYIRREVLEKITGHLIIAMDEVDRLFSCTYASEVFGLFRSWHNERASNPDGPWSRLTLAIVYATEAHLFITDQNQSPFNVGTRIELHDFGIDEVGKLNKLYELPIRTDEDLKRFYRLFNGQPYLTQRGFYDLTQRGMSMDELVALADTDEGPYGDHLRRILVLLVRDKDMLAVVKDMLHGKPIPDPMSFYRLRSGGLIAGHSAQDARFRCDIYKSYLARHLT
jgi:AAA-like domain/TIR domain